MIGKKRILSIVLAFATALPMLGNASTVSAQEEKTAVSTSTADVIHLATYYNQVPNFPQEVEGQKVTWPSDLAGDNFAAAYSTVPVEGSLEDGSVVVANVEVVPENLVYFIDTGTGTDWKTTMKGTNDEGVARTLESLPYNAVKELVGDDLQNQVSDQAYDAKSGDTWGYGYTLGGNRADPIQTYSNNNSAPADNTTISNKYDSGLRASNNTNFEYYLTLEAGTYTLTTGFHEFYDGNHNRKMKPVLKNAETGDVITSFDEVSMSNNANSTAAPDMTSVGTFSLTEKTVVQVYYEKTGGENGSMNWLAVAQGNPPEAVLNRTKLRTAIKEAEKIEGDLDSYATISKNTVSRALETAREFVNSETITQEQVDTAAQLLNAALEAMVKKDFNETRYEAVPVGETWLDTEGAPIQAHGGGFLQQEDTDGTPIYYWVGEDKSHNTSNFNGVNLYSSKDLVNWTYRNTILQPDLENAGLSNNKIERPKLVYNEATKKYVLWGHWEDKSGYSSSQICVATSDSVDGEYEFVGHWRPGADETHRNWRKAADAAKYDDGTLIEDYSDSSVWGTGSRDFTLFVEDNGIDAYLISAEDHETMRIYKLNSTFTDVERDQTTQLFNGAKREAPAIVKVGKYYFMVSSGQSGWYPNQSRYSYTTDLMDADAWHVDPTVTNKKMPDGFIGNNTSFYSQPTNIMKVTGSEGTSYIYMGDRWNANKLGDSTYVWLPLELEDLDTDTPTLKMNYVPGWALDVEKGNVVLPETKLISEGKPSYTDAKEVSDDNFKLYRANDGDYKNVNLSGGNQAYFKPVTEEGGNTVKLPFYYMIDLEDTYDLSNIDISFNCHNGSETYYAYTVDVSMNNENWTTIIDENSNKTVGFKSHDLSGNQARYVRLSVNKVINAHNSNSASWATGLVEVQVYGKEGVIQPQTETGLTAQLYKLEGEAAANHVQLKWETNANATEYKVYRAETKEDLENAEVIYTTNAASSYEDSSLPKESKTYFYQVKGYLDGQLVSSSAIAEVKTYASMPEGMDVYDAETGTGLDLKDGIVVDGVYYRYKYNTDENGFKSYVEQTSSDGKNWKDSGIVLAREDDETLSSCKFESVSIVYNESTNKVIFWGHYELKDGYSTGALFCLSGTPGKPDSFEYSGLIYPNGKQARDKAVFVDDDNTAYLVTASNDPGESANKTMYIHKLTKDWTGVDETNGYVAKLFENQHREAPAMVKSNGVYYLFTSQAAGWLPSQGMYACATSLDGPWTELKMPANTSSFGGQQNGVGTIEGSQANNYLLYASRWWKDSTTAGRVVAPLALNAGYATADYFNKFYYNVETGVLIPERSGNVVSQGKEATLNGVKAPETVDGDYATKTSVEKKWPATWQVDLGQPYNLSGIQISWYMVKGSEAHYPYIVYGSNDQNTWDKILDCSTYEDNVQKVDYGFTSEALSGKYQYVKVEIISARPHNNPNNNWYSPQLWEVKVLGNNEDEIPSVNTDKTALNLVISMAEELCKQQEDYGTFDETSYQAMKETLEAAKEMLENENATQEEIDSMVETLINACDKLTQTVQKYGLQVAIEEAQEVLKNESNKYDQESIDKVKEALDAALLVKEDSSATQEEVNQATTNLITAVTSMKEKITRLDKLIAIVEKLLEEEEKYTPSSIENLKNALEEAKKVAQDDNAEDQMINEAYDNLMKAVTELQFKADKSELKAALEKAYEIQNNKANYVESTIANLDATIYEAVQVYQDENAVQAEVNEILKSLIEELMKARLLGDINMNGVVDSDDSTQLLQYSAEIADLTTEQVEIADVNKDGNADTKDATKILQFVAEEVSSFK